MKASGNGAPEICVQNLLKTIRGEVPYERIKGIDRTLIDKPSETAATDLAADVEFLVETYAAATTTVAKSFLLKQSNFARYENEREAVKSLSFLFSPSET